MELLALDRLVAIFFLVVLVMIARVGHLLEQEDRSGYRHVVVGISLLALAAVLNSLGGSTLFAGIPMLADVGFVDLLVWIVSISGLILVVAGVSSWLPLSRYYRKYNRGRIQQLETITRVAQLIRIETRFIELMSNSARYLFEGCNLDRAVLFVLSPRRERSFHLKSFHRTGMPEIDASEIRFTDDVWQRRVSPESYRKVQLVHSLPSGLELPSMVEPVFASGRIVGIMLLWTRPDDEMIEDTSRVAAAAAKMLGRRARSMLLEEQIEYFASERNLVGQLTDLDTSDADYKTLLLPLASVLKSEIPLSTISMSQISLNVPGRRYTLGSNGALLEEVGVDFKQTTACIQSTMPGRSSLVLDSSDKIAAGLKESLLNRGALRSEVILVIGSGNGSFVQFSLAFNDASKYRTRHRYLLEAAAPVISEKLTQMETQQKKLNTERCLQALDDLSRQAVSSDFKSVARNAARLLVEHTPADCVRISVADESHLFLSSVALNTSQRFAVGIPEDGHMVLAIMPRHREAIENNKEISIAGTSTEEYGAAELSQAFAPGFKQMRIIPKRVRSGSVVISLGRLVTTGANDETSSVARLVSELLAGVYETTDEVGEISGPEYTFSLEESQTRAQVRSALAALTGAVELIEDSSGKSQTMRNYVTIMRKSINKIGTLAEQSADRSRDKAAHPAPVGTESILEI